ncbi:MAG TPA: LpxL/LpxP family Kdo(2)-lipid IV(A) lauroyl/palmitoleoyl acyltransferase [Pseudomonadales bacterium]|nr:LpxL/LpxP family Kdo(2)-lipid IV(A) lauroyl/palmitoleoyl acyltransferase [Pseudomonadales bacterium]HMW83185.1 LpxL/LpxP family Kdo(2)-lipid IV(A) lauroyl/palmitoleoyl acyltransferase [Pseudomonadales bacterium]HMZ91547.1 LpxL/LpxP family Kdo(2)-lipid IV(A) lauroyl/palmitoleoyl acyltransferase [Pseudomonadales bacterium]HNB83789.1 LpxL/LpxP family Kdo(2)-lipid IV(A) lauroyl/palmitoleoyl acyltransferase [Pseudomonadales bacterium]HNC77166.1 LpxL/LpxP family Kdo(2)-lipid IV(A) lauroyl/palmitol
MAKSKERGSLYHPRHWPSWLVIGLWYLSSFLPYRWLYQLGRPIGWLLFALGRSRAAVGRRNLALCFPELSPAQRERLLKRNFEQMGITLMETGFAWWASDRRIDRISRVEGLEQLIERQQRGEGALLISFHFLAIDLTARIVGRHGDFHALYKIQGNRVFEAVSKRIRERHHVYIIPHKQVQELLDRAHSGKLVAVVPDQDFGPRRSLFVPFFGIATATIPNVSDYARQTGFPVFPLTFLRDADGRGLSIKVYPPFDDFPSGDDFADTLRMNRFYEEIIRDHPEQYLWVHRRFKTRPPGEESLYADL